MISREDSMGLLLEILWRGNLNSNIAKNHCSAWLKSKNTYTVLDIFFNKLICQWDGNNCFQETREEGAKWVQQTLIVITSPPNVETYRWSRQRYTRNLAEGWWGRFLRTWTFTVNAHCGTERTMVNTRIFVEESRGMSQKETGVTAGRLVNPGPSTLLKRVASRQFSERSCGVGACVAREKCSEGSRRETLCELTKIIAATTCGTDRPFRALIELSVIPESSLHCS